MGVFRRRRPLIEALQLNDLAFQIFTNLHKRYRAAAGGKEQAAELRTELDSLGDVLSETQPVFQKHDGKIFSDELRKEFKALRKLLDYLDEVTKGAWDEDAKPVIWPFSKTEQDEIIGKIRHFKEAAVLNLAPRYLCPVLYV